MVLKVLLTLCELCILLMALFLYPTAAPGQELRRIHYGTTTSTAHLPIWVAKDAGLFAKNGLNVEPIHIRGGALITMGIMSGQLQFSGAGAEAIAAAGLGAETGTSSITTVTRPQQRVVDENEKLGRNDPCWCGSGKKFKRCHGA